MWGTRKGSKKAIIHLALAWWSRGKILASGARDPGFESRSGPQDFGLVSHTCLELYIFSKLIKIEYLEMLGIEPKAF